MYRLTLLVIVLCAFAASTGHAASIGIRISIQMPPGSLLYCHNAIRIAREAGRPTHDLPQCRDFEAYVKAVGADTTAAAGQTAGVGSGPGETAVAGRGGAATRNSIDSLSMQNADSRLVEGRIVFESSAP